jgi:alanine-glyoxylate transaminase/serine-glyoxylate transaminase/serine-pyruvate transaminase
VSPRPGARHLQHMFSMVVDNGVYGSGFADLVKMYGGRPVVMGLGWRLPADPAAVDRWLEKERDVEVVTLVHCDTPSALHNPLRELAKAAANHGVFLIVDAAPPSAPTRYCSTGGASAC